MGIQRIHSGCAAGQASIHSTAMCRFWPVQGADREWQYSVFTLADAAGPLPLSTLTYHLISLTGLIQELRLNEVKLGRFLRRIEAGYRDNPYHNRYLPTICATDFQVAVA